MPPKPAAIRKRACDNCYRRKIQCSSTVPGVSCEWCRRRGVDCTSDRVTPRKSRSNCVTKGDVQSLQKRIEKLENALSNAASTQQPADQNSPRLQELSTPATPAEGEQAGYGLRHGSLQLCGNHSITVTASDNPLGPNWFFNGMFITSKAGLEWMSMKTDQIVSLDKFHIKIEKYHTSAAPDSSIWRETGELPDKAFVQEIFRSYLCSPFRLAFPVLDPVLFDSTLEVAYEKFDHTLHSPPHISARACVLALLSIACLLNISRHRCSTNDSNLWAAKAESSVMLIKENSSVATLQTILLLQLQRIFTGGWQEAAVLNSMACRLVCSLGGHLLLNTLRMESGDGCTVRESSHVRALFWICYIVDKDMSLRVGTPPLLTDCYCDLSLPDKYVAFRVHVETSQESFEDSGDSAHETLSPQLPGDIILSCLKEKVFRQIFSARAMGENNNQLLLNIRRLDDEIESWRLSIPAHFRPALLVTQAPSLDILKERVTHLVRRISIQLEYQHLMTVLHSTVRRCNPESIGNARDLHEVVHSSFDLSLVASRSTIWCINSLVEVLAEESIRFIAYYSTTAAMALFLNIIIHPLDPPAQSDLGILISACNSMRSIPLDNLTSSESCFVKETIRFHMRLVWLGSCAMAKEAKMEAG